MRLAKSLEKQPASEIATLKLYFARVNQVEPESFWTKTHRRTRAESAAHKHTCEPDVYHDYIQTSTVHNANKTSVWYSMSESNELCKKL